MTTKVFGKLYFFHPKSKIKAGDGLDKGAYPFYTSSSIQKKWIDKSEFNTKALIFGTGGSASLHFADGRFGVSTDCFVASSQQEEVNIKYTFYYLKHNFYVLERGFKGAGLEHIGKPYIENIAISYPELEIQNKIVAVLDKANNLIERMVKIISLYDDLLRATFLDIFGDSATNPKGWERSTLQKLCSKIIDCPHETPIYSTENSGFYCIRSSDIQNDNIDLSETKTVSEQTFLERIKRHEPKGGEVAYTREGGRLGNAARIPSNKKICLGQRMMLFVANEKISTNEFIWALLNSNSIKKKVTNISGGGAAPRINIRQLKTLEAFIPPLELQMRFAKIVRTIEAIKALQKQSLQKLNYLFSSLSQSAFKGELTFNTAVDLEVLMENDYDFFKKNSNSKSIELLIERLNKDELNEKTFYEQEMYNKAKSFLFELLKEAKVLQSYDEETKTIKLSVQ
jgi:type I restriction enzyme S subunit